MRTERTIKRLIAAFLVISALVDASGPTAWAQAEKTTVDRSYRLHVGDRLNVKIYPDDEYLRGGEVEIGADGHITLPILGKIPLVDRSVVEAEQDIAALLAEDYLVNPQVAIEVLKYQKSTFVVLGQVSKPGTYEFPPGEMRTTLLNAISMAGGFSAVANIKKIKIMKKRAGQVLNANAEDIIGGRSRDIEITADDVVHVSESLF